MKTMYHFTASHLYPSIKKQGLTLGKMLKTEHPVTFIDDKQWLTVNKSFDQSWSVGTGRLPYKRNEIRLTIVIPTSHEHNLKPWSQMKFYTPAVADILSSKGDPENWFIYDGHIKPNWITKKLVNPYLQGRFTLL